MSSREDVDLAPCLLGTAMATRVELSPTNLSTATKDFFHSGLEYKVREVKKKKKEHLEIFTLHPFHPLCGDKIMSVQLSAMLAVSSVKGKANNVTHLLLLHENLLNVLFSYLGFEGLQPLSGLKKLT